MSSSFRLRYLFGLIPNAQKIDSAWTELSNMHNELQQIETSKELARYNELNSLVQSNDFQTKKNAIVNLNFIESPERQSIVELAKLERSKPIKDYFRFIQSPDFSRLNKIADSSELFRYFELQKIVEAPEFIRRKKDTESFKYKGSPEFIKRQEYNAVQKNSRLKFYNTTIASDEYRLFLDLEVTEKEKLNGTSAKKDPKFKIYRKYLNSKAYKNIQTVERLGLVAELEQLKLQVEAKSFVEREAFLKNAARFETTSDYPPFNEFSGLAQSADIQFYLKTVKSPLYANYKKIEESDELARLFELRSKVEDSEFKQRVIFLQNKKRFESTPEFKLEAEFKGLDKSKILSTYRLLKKKPELAYFDQWEITLDENFSDNKLDTTIWEPENYWGFKMAGYSFSQANESQGYNGIKNIEIKNNVLSIVTKTEKIAGKSWNPAIGLIPKQFEHSSAILNTGNGFKFKEGVIEAKVKFNAETAITSAFSLTGSHPFPQIDVFRSGNNSVGLGVVEHPDNKGVKKLVQVKGLNFNNFHIFRLEIFGNSLVWKINNYEVHREQLTLNAGELFLNFVGSLHQPINGSAFPHHFEIDWVRCSQKK